MKCPKSAVYFVVEELVGLTDFLVDGRPVSGDFFSHHGLETGKAVKPGNGLILSLNDGIHRVQLISQAMKHGDHREGLCVPTVFPYPG